MSFSIHRKSKIFIVTALSIFCLGMVVQAQEHPLSRIDSAVVIENLSLHDSLKSARDYRGASAAINEVAFTYWNNNHFQTAIKYYQMSLEYNEMVANENGIAMINNNLGMLYADVGLYGLSLEFFTKTLAARRANKEKVGIYSALVNMHLVLNKLRRYDESIELLREATDIALELQDFEQLRSVYGYLAETYEKKGLTDSTLYYFQLYKSFHEEVQEQEIRQMENELLAEQVAKEKAVADNAIKENEILKQQLQIFEQGELISEQDSINASLYAHLDRTGLINQMLAQDTLNKQLELRAQQSENEKLASEKKSLARVTMLVLATALIVTTLIGIIIWRTKRHNTQLTKKNKAIEKQKVELNDANIKLNDANSQLTTTNEELATTLDELRATKDKLVLSGKMASLGAFTAGIAHEVNNSNNYVAGSADMLCKIIEDEKEALRSIISPEDLELIDDLKNTIRLGVNKTNTLFKNLQNSEQYGTSFFPIDMAQAANECINVIQKKAKDKKIDFVKDYPESVTADGHSQMIHQIIINLLDNAIDASEDGGQVSLSIHDAGNNQLIIKIKDNGAGIPKEHIEKIYDPFFSTKQIGEGSGMGLYMVYGYVSKHNGTIDLDTGDNGTEMTVTIPIHQEPENFESETADSVTAMS